MSAPLTWPEVREYLVERLEQERIKLDDAGPGLLEIGRQQGRTRLLRELLNLPEQVAIRREAKK